MSDGSTGTQRAQEPMEVRVVEPQRLFERLSALTEQIAHRAYELFDLNGKREGHEVEDWLGAESELLHPAHVCVSEKDGAIVVETDVPGFTANDIEISVEPQRLTINGKKKGTGERLKDKNILYREQCSDEILRVIQLPFAIDTTRARATLRNGVLEINLPMSLSERLAIERLPMKEL